MRTFQFRLATLLRLRQAVRDERRGQLAEALAAAAALSARLDELDRDLNQLKQQQTCRAGSLDLDRLLEADRYEAMLRAQRAEVQRQRDAVAVEIDKRREAVVAADRDLKALQQLEELQGKRHRAAEERQNVKELDETASRRAREKVHE
ncbi:MAG: hypothetical protein WD847_08000 [Pirellulales bacterium]